MRQTFRALFPSHNNTGHEGFIYLATCLQPKSRGNITLKSKNFMDPPQIEPAYLENEDDVSCIRQGNFFISLIQLI